MGIEVLRETTDWAYPNHTYVLQNGQLIGYKKKGTDTFKFFSPIHFNKRYRTFAKAPASDVEDAMIAI